MTKKTSSELSNINMQKIFSNKLAPAVVNGIVKTKFNNVSNLWVAVFRMDGTIACRTAKTKEKAVYSAFRTASL